MGYAEHIPSLSNPNDDIPNLGFVLGICKSQNTKPNPKASRTQFGFWYDHDWPEAGRDMLVMYPADVQKRSRSVT